MVKKAVRYLSIGILLFSLAAALPVAHQYNDTDIQVHDLIEDAQRLLDERVNRGKRDRRCLQNNTHQ